MVSMSAEAAAGLRTGDLAQAAGVNQQTLRYYERRGLLAPTTRTLGGHRLYSAHAVTVLRVIKAAQRLGFTLAEIAELIDVGRHHHGRTDASLQVRARAKLHEVESRIADLQEIRSTLQAALDAGCDDIVECAVADGCPLPFAALAPVGR
jgi:DNA-binding transcriptional MerR regulator